jgi:DNA-binding beta-propeller fold protein YncE
MKQKLLVLMLVGVLIASCKKNDLPCIEEEDAASFTEISSTTIGKAGAAEISAYDPLTKKLFVVTNAGTSQIDVLDLSNPAAPAVVGSIDITPYGGGVNSVSVKKGTVAAAVEGVEKTDGGKVVIFKTTDYSLVTQVPVGALPDMITFSADGRYILTANEGEPNDDYTIDPVGSVSIISVKDNYAVTNVDFSSFASQKEALMSKGLRVFGPGASFAQDMEPEYLAVSEDGKTAWVTLQENNAIAKIDIGAKQATAIYPLGFKNYNTTANAIDPSDKDGSISLNRWNVRGMYQPDAIALFEKGGFPFLFTANEGDVREYDGFEEAARVKDLVLDAASFPDAATLQQDDKLGRLNVTKTLGDGDGDHNLLYSFGARSFSVWQGNTGQLVYDSKNDLEQKCIVAGLYDDARSDDKGVEPEGITLGAVGKKTIAFIGMERADALAIYDVSDPFQPEFLKLLPTGDAPEGITFIPPHQSPVGRSLVVVSSENDGTIKVYKTN